MTTAVLSLGSNLGDSLGYLRAAVHGLATDVRSVSPVYRTPPWGPVPQDDFLNIAVIVSNDAVDADGWLRRCQGLEAAAHRERPVRWGPRTLDADVVAVWQRAPGAFAGESAVHGHDDVPGLDAEPVISSDPVLTLPHPRAHERAFVLVPWAEIQPDAILPGRGSVAELLAGLDTSGIARVGDLGAEPGGGTS
jgi:2-amino-4-hydroxy-6-hydroxymethyldihydropteridine diphosphokinase